jgi:hypothetical protein
MGGKNHEDIIKELAYLTDEISENEWIEIADLARRNSVSGLIYNVTEHMDKIPEGALNMIKKYTGIICRSNYRLLIIDIWLTKVLKNAGIKFCIMKGVAAAADFTIPEYRKSGDVDILLADPGDVDRAIVEIEKLGFKTDEEQVSLHHVSMSDSTGLEIEIHTMLAEPFDNKKINGYLGELLSECGKNIVTKEIMGVNLPVLEDGYHAYELLLHMLQHFLRSGFGVKLLCDWVVLWNRGLNEKSRHTYMRLVKESGIKGFSDMITRACIKYLGLKREQVLWMALFDNEKNRDEIERETELFMKELMEAEEFGKSRGRMVALRGDGVFDYIREFHHQMHLNFPKTGKCFLLWPILWIITLMRFLRNNKKVRAISSKELFSSAGKRGKLVKHMNLFS